MNNPMNIPTLQIILYDTGKKAQFNTVFCGCYYKMHNI